MNRNILLARENTIYRVLAERENDKALVIDCRKRTMPGLISMEVLAGFEQITEEQLLVSAGIAAEALEHYSAAQAHRRFTLIAPILPVIGDKEERSSRIRAAAELGGLSVQTIRHSLCDYLAFQDIRVLAMGKVAEKPSLTADEANMRWALNKFYYTSRKLPLTKAYLHMLKEKYTDDMGQLLAEHPSIYQFRYFHAKYEKLQTKYISRDGIKDYQRNNRPLLGDRVQEFATATGLAMLDATVCDIYLVNEEGQLVGRPELVAAVDAYSGLCIGYMLAWEGGTYTLRGLTLSMLADKVEACRKHGLQIREEDWPGQGALPGMMVTDMGSEYTSGTFEQIAELGVTVVNLPSYRPELKGPVESFFNTVQGYFKDELKGKGVIEPNFQERGAHDYRKDASLTLDDFEKVLLRCIIYYNSQRVVEGFPYTEEMLDAGVKPYANSLYEYGRTLPGANLIPCSKEQLVMTLLPRTRGRFQRDGLKVNGMRYKDCTEDHAFTENYLRGGEAAVAYNPDDVDQVWLLRDGQYIPFRLIESRFRGSSMDKVLDLKERQREMVRAEAENNLQAKLDLVEHIRVIAGHADERRGNAQIKDIRKTRQKERSKAHIDYCEAGKGKVAE